MGNFTVSLKKLTEKVSMEVVYEPPQKLENISVEIAEVNRPGLFLAGYYDYFDKLRLQIMGLAEINFLAGLPEDKRRERLDRLFCQQPPAVIVCRSEELQPLPEMLELAQKRKIPTILVTRFPKSPAAQKADVVLCCGSTETPFQFGSVPAAVAQLVLMDFLYQEYFRRNREKCEENIQSIAMALAEKHI